MAMMRKHVNVIQKESIKYFADDIFRCIFVIEKIGILIKNFGLDNGLASNRQQDIIWTNDNLVHCRIHAALGEDELRLLNKRILRQLRTRSMADGVGFAENTFWLGGTTVIEMAGSLLFNRLLIDKEAWLKGNHLRMTAWYISSLIDPHFCVLVD